MKILPVLDRKRRLDTSVHFKFRSKINQNTNTASLGLSCKHHTKVRTRLRRREVRPAVGCGQLKQTLPAVVTRRVSHIDYEAFHPTVCAHLHREKEEEKMKQSACGNTSDHEDEW